MLQYWVAPGIFLRDWRIADMYLFPMATPGRPGDIDPLFPFLEWETDSKLSEYIRSRYLGQSSKVDMHRAGLRFYTNFNLLRMTFPADLSKAHFGARRRRGYALYTPSDLSNIKPLDGTSVPIHETNKIKGELDLSEGNADDYLRFFCSVGHGEGGPFLVLHPKNYEDVVPLDDNRDARKRLEDEKAQWLRTVTDKEKEKLPNPFPQSEIRARVASIIYSSVAFRAWFAIDNSPENPGMVQMLEDEPILTNLRVDIPTYGYGGLFVPRLPEEGHASAPYQPSHYYTRPSTAEDDEINQLLTKLTTPAAGEEGEIVFNEGHVQEQK